LATPREVVAQIAREAVVRAEGIERLPHDLWPETDLPPLTFAQRLSLVLAGFDLSYQYEGGGQTVRLIALPDKAVVRREYARPGLNARTLAEIRQRFPQARIVQETAPLMIEATVEQHEAIRQWLAGPAKQPKQPGRQKPLEHRHTLTVQRATLRAVADSLEKQLGLTIQFDPAVTGKLKEMVSFEVKNATLDELLRAWLEPAGLTYQMDEQRILILPSPDR
jgi:hypothetical protein